MCLCCAWALSMQQWKDRGASCLSRDFTVRQDGTQAVTIFNIRIGLTVQKAFPGPSNGPVETHIIISILNEETGPKTK